MITFRKFGEPIGASPEEASQIAAVKSTYRAILKHPGFKYVSFVRISTRGKTAEAIVVDVENHDVPTRNKFGIQFRERLALCFTAPQTYEPEVFPLRDTFPTLIHTNQGRSAPSLRSLCLSVEDWRLSSRSWTPQKHLKSILWWMSKAGSGALHAPDQPVEPIYFHSRDEILLPRSFGERLLSGQSDSLICTTIRKRRDNSGTLLAEFSTNIREDAKRNYEHDCIIISADPIVQGVIERFPSTLGELEFGLAERSASIKRQLFEAIVKIFSGRPASQESVPRRMVLIVCVQVTRSPGQPAELIGKHAFYCEEGAAGVGLAAGVLHALEGQIFAVPLLDKPTIQSKWESISIHPLEIAQELDLFAARQHSGIQEPGPQGSIVGLGALGSSIAMHWIRSGWGRWTFIDTDRIKPHNLVRHEAFAEHIGYDKAVAMATLAERIHSSLDAEEMAIVADGADFSDERLLQRLKESEVIIDCTADVLYGFLHGQRDELPRGLTVFLNPSGNDAVLIAEDSRREIRLDSLEAQYYRFIRNAPWGLIHSAAAGDGIRTGAGCRDRSVVIGGDLVHLHASLLANYLRKQVNSSSATIRIWRSNPGDMSIETESVIVHPPLFGESNSYRIVWDTGLRERVEAWRKRALPNETGGILVGIYDLIAKRIYLVDALPAPPDSEETPSSFRRGLEGVQSAIEQVALMSGGRVGYVGEWHTHPDCADRSMSKQDRELLEQLKAIQAGDGLPVVMMIVAKDGVNLTVEAEDLNESNTSTFL